MRRFDAGQRRARLGVRHHLVRPSSSVLDVAGDLAGLHSTDPVTPYLSVRARVDGFERADLEDALYEQRTLVRILGMRRTLFVVPRELAAVVDAACAKALVAAERRRLVGMLEDQGLVDDADRWLDGVADRVLRALDERGQATASELTTDVGELGLKITFGEGKRWAGQVGVSTRLLFLLATSGHIVRARPRGTWVSTQYRWARTADWLGCDFDELAADHARAALATRWLRTNGPGTETDLKWWTGWTLGATRAALQAAGAVEVETDDGPAFVLGDDLEDVPAPRPWVALLPPLDSTVMAYKQRDWYLGDLGPQVFDRNGNAGPTIWADGRVVGGWAQLADGTVATSVLVDVGAATLRRIETEAARLQAWLGDARFTPRFRTPLEQEMTRR